MPLTIYNSLSKKKEIFSPINQNEVRMYTCGPTVYDAAHVGNFRTFLFEDILKRILLYNNYSVVHIMNITDVDDKTIKRSNDEGKTLSDLTQSYTELFFQDLNWLRILPADNYPKATDHIPEMIEIIEKLIEKGFAYKTEDNSIFFKISAYPDYGKLVRIKKDLLKVSNRNDADEYTKDNPQDFSLWKGYKPEDGDVGWESPWGRGRPGWHIECSAMSMKYLGNYFDIHCGGVDNMFPHHENEIAQSCAATNSDFVKYWIHGEFLQISGDKMSKSEGNMFRIDELKTRGFLPEVLRYLLLSGHYRTKLNFSPFQKNEGQQAIQRIVDVLSKLKFLVGDENFTSLNPIKEQIDFVHALENDLDTPRAFAILFTWIKEINKQIETNDLTISSGVAGIQFLKIVDDCLGIILSYIDVPKLVKNLMNKRVLARESSDWTLADKIRDELYELGWKIEDTPLGSECKPILSSNKNQL